MAEKKINPEITIKEFLEEEAELREKYKWGF